MSRFALTSAILLVASSAPATSVSLYTDFDRAIFRYSDDPALAVSRYLEEQGITEEEMIERVATNIAEHVAKADGDPARYLAAGNSLMTLQWMTTPKAMERLESYTAEEYPAKLRTIAVRRFLASSKLSGLNLASNVMTQAWRSPDEHNTVRTTYRFLSKSAPPETLDRYVDFFKWSNQNGHLGAYLKTWDRNTIELDPSWRTNTARRASAEFQKQFLNSPTGTNNLLNIIHDYELSVGPRQPDAPPEETPDTPPSATDALTNAVRVAAVPASPPETAAPRSWKPAIALGVVLLAAIAIIGTWKCKSKDRPQ